MRQEIGINSFLDTYNKTVSENGNYELAAAEEANLDPGITIYEEEHDSNLTVPKEEPLDLEVNPDQDVLELDDIGGSLDADRQEPINEGQRATLPDTEAKGLTRTINGAPQINGGNEAKCLWISNLSSETRTSDLKTIIGNFGKVYSAKVVASTSSKDGNKYYGFIIMQNEAEAQACVDNLNNTEIHGKVISIEKRYDQPGKSSNKSSPTKTDAKSTPKSDSFSSSRPKEPEKPKTVPTTSSSRTSTAKTESSRNVSSGDARKTLDQKRSSEHKSSDRREPKSSRESSHAKQHESKRSPPRSSRPSSSTHRERERSRERRPASSRVSTEVSSHRSDRRSRSRDRLRGETRELRHLLDKRAVETHRESDRLIREREEQLLLREREERKLEEERKLLLQEKLERERIVKERLELQREMLMMEKERQIAEQKLLKEAEELKRMARLQRDSVASSSSLSRPDDRRRKYSQERDRSADRSRRDAKYSRTESDRDRGSGRKDSRHRGSSRERRRTPPRHEGTSSRRVPSPRKLSSPTRRAASPPRRESSASVRIVEERNRNGSGSDYHRRPEKPAPMQTNAASRNVQRQIPEIQPNIRELSGQSSVPVRGQPILTARDLDLRPQVVPEDLKRTIQVQDVSRQRVIPSDHPRALQGMGALLNPTALPVTSALALPILDPRQFYTNVTPAAQHIEYSSATYPDVAYGSSRTNRNVGLR